MCWEPQIGIPFQFPPVFLKKTALVISPLIALMEDQVLGLEVSNVRACMLGSGQQGDIAQLEQDIKDSIYRLVSFFSRSTNRYHVFCRLQDRLHHPRVR